jgi:hypothetical protein
MPLTDTTLEQFKTGSVFIETGTLHGDGITKALKAGFTKIISIEIDPKFVVAANIRFKNEVAAGTVRIVQGDTKLVMTEVLKEINSPATFWLDAHWDGGVKGMDMCPLYSELMAIKEHPIKTHTILIDDMRLVRVRPKNHWSYWVSVEGTIDILMMINQDYKVSYTDGDLGPDGGIAKNDIMVARATK